jgi:hypothetical protein
MTSPFLSSKVEHGILTFSFTRPDKSNNYDAAVNAMTRRLAREPISPAVLDELQRAFLFAADSAAAEAAPRLAPPCTVVGQPIALTPHGSTDPGWSVSRR